MFPAENHLDALLQKRKSEGAFRTLQADNNLIDFCSNDYLGFARSVELKEKINSFKIADHPYFIGSTGSRLIRGNTTFAEDLEKQIALFHKAPAGLIFNSGYDANLGLFSSVPREGDTILYDELVHASIHDGMRLSKADRFMFRHNDMEHLETRLQQAKGLIYVAVESIYSMDGDAAPLRDIIFLCEKYNAHLVVDEAHATGLFGFSGEGLVVEQSLENKVFARVHTFGKALGCHGAIVLGSEVLRNYLINYSRSFIYTTALPVHSLVSIKCAYDYLSVSIHIINKTSVLISLFKEKVKTKNLSFIESNSPVQCLIIPGNEVVSKVASQLQEGGFDVRAIKSPTVPKGKERLRICIHAFNTEEEISRLVNTLKSILL